MVRHVGGHDGTAHRSRSLAVSTVDCPIWLVLIFCRVWGMQIAGRRPFLAARRRHKSDGCSATTCIVACVCIVVASFQLGSYVATAVVDTMAPMSTLEVEQGAGLRGGDRAMAAQAEPRAQQPPSNARGGAPRKVWEDSASGYIVARAVPSPVAQRPLVVQPRAAVLDQQQRAAAMSAMNAFAPAAATGSDVPSGGVAGAGAAAAGSTTGTKRWLAIGIPTVPRPKSKVYLLETLEIMLAQLPTDPTDPMFGRVRFLPAEAWLLQVPPRALHWLLTCRPFAGVAQIVLVVVNNAKINAPHPAFEQAVAKYAGNP